MYTVDEYVRKNGIQQVLKALEEIANDEEEPHTFAMKNKIDMDKWFDFLTQIDMVMSGSYRNSALAIPGFNYIDVEDAFATYVEENSPIEYGRAVEYTTENVDSVDDEEDVARWCEFMDIKENEEGLIVSAERSYTSS